MDQVERQKKEWDELDEETKERWGQDVIENLLQLNGRAASLVEDPQHVVSAMKHAIKSTAPHIRCFAALFKS